MQYHADPDTTQTTDILDPDAMRQLEFPQTSEGRLREALLWVLENDCRRTKVVTMERDYRFRAQDLLKQFGDCPLSDLVGRNGIERLDAEWQALADSGLSSATIRKRFSFLLRALRKAAQRELVDGSRIPDMPKFPSTEKPQADIFHTFRDYEKVRAHVSTDWHRLAIDLAYWTGMHTADLYKTKWSHLDFGYEFRDLMGTVVGTGGWHMRNQKNGVDHWLPMDDGFEVCLREYLQHHETHADMLVTGTMHRASQWLYPACDRAQVRRIPLKNFRQSRTQYLIAQGYDDNLLAYQLGHKNEGRKIRRQHYYGVSPGPAATALMIGRQAARRVEMSEAPAVDGKKLSG